MAFDPAKPAFGSPDSSAEMREQLNALKELIDAQAAQIAGLQIQITDQTAQIASLQANLSAAFAGSANNILNVLTLALVVSDPPSQPQVQAIADKVDQLINTLRRP